MGRTKKEIELRYDIAKNKRSKRTDIKDETEEEDDYDWRDDVRKEVAVVNAALVDVVTKSDGVRPTWDSVWMDIATTISKRSIDPRMKVGAIVVNKDNTQMLALGYNGDYAGGPNRVESLEPGKSGTLHAELNALIKCDYSQKNKVMYITHSPCIECAKIIINAKVQEVIYEIEYRDSAGIELLKKMGVYVRQFKK